MSVENICPCCERHHFENIDFFEVCPVCLWLDDGVQRDNPNYSGGANKLSLNEFRKRWKVKQLEKAV